MYGDKEKTQQKKYYSSKKGKVTRKKYQDKYYKEYYRRNNEKKRLQTRKYRLKRNFGITLEEYNKIFDAQGGKCAVCKEYQQGKMLAVDHNHITGKNRGLLCQLCNTALGSLKDSQEIIKSLLVYVEYWDRV